MSISTLPLSYCTNVHPAMTVPEVIQGLETYTARMREMLNTPLAAGLWLAQPVIQELMDDPRNIEQLRDALNRNNLSCHTLNAFPYGNFHSERVKEQVYLPDWSSDQRRIYTEQCAQVLTQLLPEGTEGSLSTLPLGFKQFSYPETFEEDCLRQLLRLARKLDELHDETGNVIRLAIEPEPLCLLETTKETLAFFERLEERAAHEGLAEIVRRHLGVCYDVCHQAVEFEDVAASIQSLHAAGVRLNKIHISCALRLRQPSNNQAGREMLAEYIEPRYLHQTIARLPDGEVVHWTDLDQDLCSQPPIPFQQAEEWRVHFHVPVNVESYGALETTRPDLQQALEAVAELEYAPHLEIETYTWRVMTGKETPDLVESLTAEVQATREMLDQCPKNSPA